MSHLGSAVAVHLGASEILYHRADVDHLDALLYNGSRYLGTDSQAVLLELVLANIVAYKMHASSLHARKNLR